jgi:hypothetical protein
MTTVGVGFERTHGKQLYPALPDLPCTPFPFARFECITLAMWLFKVCSRNSYINVLAFFSIHVPRPLVAGFAIGAVTPTG